MVSLPEGELLTPLWDEREPCAGRLLRLRTRHHAYHLAREGKLPVETIQVGARLYVRTADLRRVLGLPEPEAVEVAL
jgi:hypothetical protein